MVEIVYEREEVDIGELTLVVTVSDAVVIVVIVVACSFEKNDISPEVDGLHTTSYTGTVLGASRKTCVLPRTATHYFIVATKRESNPKYQLVGKAE